MDMDRDQDRQQDMEERPLAFPRTNRLLSPEELLDAYLEETDKMEIPLERHREKLPWKNRYDSWLRANTDPKVMEQTRLELIEKLHILIAETNIAKNHDAFTGHADANETQAKGIQGPEEHPHRSGSVQMN
ncbi:unnamed protein product [Arabidopsis halleri]